MALQHTIEKPVKLTGVGLHTGDESTITLNPAPENYGIRFVRTDTPDEIEILADIDNVVEVSFGTTIGKNGVKVHTIEHLMAAFAGMRIDNCRIDVNGQEVPVMDGSALPFVELIKKSGIKEQPAQREFLVIDKPMWLYNKDNTAMSVFPSDHFHVTLLIDYNHPALGAQHTTLFSLDDFAEEFAPARTFCFLSWVEKIREQGLIKGGSPDAAMVVLDVPLTDEHIEYLRSLFNIQGPVTAGDNGFLNNVPLRFYNELCRHKAVDLTGDLYLLGKPLAGHVLGARTGHAANIELARKIREYVNKREEEKAKAQAASPVGFKDILELLPHRYPFLLVDKIESVVPGKSITAIKNVSFNDNFFQGHFPGNPIMPGVLQIEAMAQAAGVMALFGSENPADNDILFLGADKVRWRGIVRPGDTLRMEVETLQYRRKTLKFAGKCYVGNKVVCEAEMMAMVGRGA
ncbi:MAG: bifunctional UDP-3-O-[3-hydroxymyristoyl] N-acetylglucosamine deacetylase/3-hydroxyacyl-ACP dehydratase [Fibrobacterota bacterium]